jgi:AraC-like DNA-binding protein
MVMPTAALAHERSVQVAQPPASAAKACPKSPPRLHGVGAGDNNSVVPRSCRRGGLPPRTLRRICHHIDANIGQRISVSALAELANLSVWYFVRAFKDSVGATPHDYLMQRRVEFAMRLLSDTDMALSEIALAAGFTDQSHCARRFRRHVGMSPQDFRWRAP